MAYIKNFIVVIITYALLVLLSSAAPPGQGYSISSGPKPEYSVKIEPKPPFSIKAGQSAEEITPPNKKPEPLQNGKSSDSNSRGATIEEQSIKQSSEVLQSGKSPDSNSQIAENYESDTSNSGRDPQIISTSSNASLTTAAYSIPRISFGDTTSFIEIQLQEPEITSPSDRSIEEFSLEINIFHWFIIYIILVFIIINFYRKDLKRKKNLI